LDNSIRGSRGFGSSDVNIDWSILREKKVNTNNSEDENDVGLDLTVKT